MLKDTYEKYYYDQKSLLIMKGTDEKLSPTRDNKLIDGKLDPIIAFTTGKLKVDGDAGKALEFSKLLK